MRENHKYFEWTLGIFWIFFSFIIIIIIIICAGPGLIGPGRVGLTGDPPDLFSPLPLFFFEVG
jgi:hypothetical protein